ncbi:hypothetical protein QR680_010130 [Steinernema hermaphroditum]|uniref:C-type lectin domain-containing protein n=1 Tax=Steinernema hermaphroditum TaxID=289476 RepID=A0AA39IPS2_9BILA|nr:hypothetical protein QR680_010130 [Steinernema hermaphroditum]
MIILRLLLLLTVIHSAIGAEWCPPGTVATSNDKQCFVRVDQKLSYKAASEHCEHKGGKLAVVESQQDLERIPELNPNGAVDFSWIGEMKTEEDIPWKWASQSDINALPNFKEKEFAKRTLMLINGQVAFVQSCYEAPAVCVVGKSPKPAEFECPHDGVPSADKRDCFVRYGNTNSKVTAENANKKCHESGGSLAWIADQNDAKIVEDLSKTHIPDLAYWISGATPNLNLNWGSKNVHTLRQPNASKFSLALLQGLLYVDDACIPHGFICRVPKTKCPKGWTLDEPSRKCYLVSTVNNGVNWHRAEQLCEQQDSHLASVTSSKKNDLLGQLAHSAGLKGDLWIGAVNEAGLANDNAKWKWINGEPWGYTNWNGALSNTPGKAQCGKYSFVSKNMVSALCETFNKAFVCERPSSLADVPNAHNPCPEGWKNLGDNCYQHFSSQNKREVSWMEASQHCRQIGSHLASIHSMREHQFVASLATGTTKEDSMWIGLEVEPGVTMFKWSDGSIYNFWHFRSLWNDGRPTYVRVTPSYPDSQWENVQPGGEKTYHYVCEFSLTEQNTGLCANGWEHNGMFCYKFFKNKEQISWANSKKNCLSAGSHLVSIHSEEENQFVGALANSKNYNDNPWIGLIVGKSNSSYAWSDGTPFDFAKWYIIQDIDDEETYSQMFLNRKDFGWENYYGAGMKHSRNYICKRNPCPYGWRLFENNCYKYFSGEHGEEISWFKSSQQCRLYGSHLASINSADENQFIASLAKNKSSAASPWIGLEVLPFKSAYKWTDGSIYTFNAWRKLWNDGRPTYGRMSMVDPKFAWENMQNTGDPTYHYVCKFNLYEPNAETCPNGWAHNGRYCYNYFKSEKQISWADSNKNCLSVGSHLASIHSEEENQFVGALANSKNYNDNPWLGLIVGKSNSSYAWSDGTPFDFAKWYIIQDIDTEDTYIQLFLNRNDFGWENYHGVGVEHNRHYVCKRNPCPVRWLNFEGSCYRYFINPDKKPLSWTEARDKCRLVSSELASSHSEEENKFIGSLAESTALDNSPWIGLEIGPYLKSFKWADGSKYDFHIWNKETPNPALTFARRIAMILRKLLLLLASAHVCLSAEYWCPPGTAEASNNECYVLMEQKMTYSDAIESCAQKGGKLAVVKSQQDLDQISKLGTSDAVDFSWIGEMKTEEDIPWKWASQSDINALPNFKEMEFAKRTLMLIKGQVAFVQTCYEAPAVCQVGKSQKPVQFECPNDGVPSADKRDCFVRYGNPNAQFNAQSAAEKCQENGGSLAWMEDQDDVKILEDLSKTHVSYLVFWIGGAKPNLKLNWNHMEFYPTSSKYNLALLQGVLYVDDECIPHGFICRIPKTKCPTGWVLDEPSRKCFVAEVQTGLTWKDAENVCLGRNGHLASITSPRENDFVSKIVEATGVQSPLWLGGINEEGLANDKSKWRWISGASWGYTNWNGDFSNSPGKSQCAKFAPTSNKWTSNFCDEKAGALACEQPANLDHTTQSYNPCPSGWFNFGDNCYQYFTSPNLEKISWSESYQQCRHLGSHLASIHSEREHFFVASLANSTAYEAAMWIGLEIQPDATSFTWSDGSLYDFNAWHLLTADPNMHRYAQIMTSYPNMGWVDFADYGTKTYHYVCKFSLMEPATNPCPDGWSHRGGQCYQYFIEEKDGEKTAITWEDSHKRCRDQGAHLASIHSEEENNFVATLTDKRGWYDSPWIGMIVGINNSSFGWSDGSPYQYSKWNAIGVKDELSYGQIIFDKEDFSWINFINYGTNTFQYVCKYDLTPRRIDPCAGGWSNFGDNCYQFFTAPNQQTISWTDSHRQCRILGSELVSIHSSREQNFVSSLANSTAYESAFWIGLQVQPSGTSFKWSDASSYDFTYWSSLAKADYVRYVQVMTSWNMGWADFDDTGTNTYHYVCEYSLLEPPKNPCPETWTHWGGYCYKYFATENKEKITWKDARQHCLNEKADLVSIHSDREQNFVAALANSNDYYDSPWIGLIVGAESSSFEWSDGTPYQYSKWGSLRSVAEDTYAEIHLNDDGNGWVNYVNFGTQTHQYVCKFESASEPTKE